MRNRNIRIVCLILIICTLFSGVWLENIETESAFVYNSEYENDPVVLKKINILRTSDHCTVKRALVQKNNIQKKGQYITKKADIKLWSHLLCSEHFLLFWESLIKNSEEIKGCGRFSKDLVTNFIQKSDGKKRILL